jgi:hypothetical protein
MCVYLWKQNKKHMILSASTTVGGQEIDIVVNYNHGEGTIEEVLEICINKVDVSPSLIELGADDKILDCIDWADLYYEQKNNLNNL